MKYIILFAISLLFSFFVFGQNNNVQQFYVGTYTVEGADGIYFCELNTKSGEVTLKNSVGGIASPSFLKLSPNKKYLYAVSEAKSTPDKPGSFIFSYQLEKDGNLILLNKQSSNGQGPCYVDVSADGKYVATATYGGGTTSLYPVASNGSLNEATSVIINSDEVAGTSRQNKPHAHSIQFSPYDQQVFSADLGTDQLNIYELKNNELKNSYQNFVKLASGAGPRHFVFHPNKEMVYVINELNSTISALRRVSGNWEVFQNITTLPENYDGDSYCADIHISKDGSYLYGSNRGHNSIAVFEINKKYHTLERLGTVSVEGNWPRNFGLTPDGKWMLVANQKSNDITVFKINIKTGVPEFSGKKIGLPAPVCIEFL